MTNHAELIQKAKMLRKGVLDLALKEGGSHLGGCFSEIEILISLFERILSTDDQFILSKGHCCLPYFILLREQGKNPTISGHPEIDLENGIPCTTGSLGHGLPIAVGKALAKKLKNEKGRIFVLLGEGDCQEGTFWESSLLIEKFQLDNIIVIIDHNKIQALDHLEDALPLNNFSQKLQALGYDLREINGHDYMELIAALDIPAKNRGVAVLAHTTKGKGVSYMENNPEWHGRKVKPERVEQAYRELS